MTKKTISLSARVRQTKALHTAWRHVRVSAITSKSADTVREVEEFERDAASHLDRIRRSLTAGTFKFSASRGVAIQKPGKSSKRPVVIAPLRNRIVQRAILDVLQSIPEISTELKSGFNFGGVEGKDFGVKRAIQKARDAATNSNYFVRTDIKSFFVNVPREPALKIVLRHVEDSKFKSLVSDATVTELNNLATLSETERKLFPLYGEGVAQGSSLSPLLCNLYLADFDRKMNGRGITCIRYIDDFIIFGPDQKTTRKAFSSSLKILKQLGLDAYDPIDAESKGKAEQGNPKDGFEFLGCEVRPDSIIPSQGNRHELINKIHTIFNEAILEITNPIRAVQSGKSYGHAIRSASNTVRAWGNTFSFCTDNRVMDQLDSKLDELFKEFNQDYGKHLRNVGPLDRRRLLGFFALKDCNRDPDVVENSQKPNIITMNLVQY